MIKFIEGDLLVNTVGTQAIGHGCNCQGVMGAGVAGQIAIKHPSVKERYQIWCSKGAEPGTIQPVQVAASYGWVVNMFTQVVTGPHAHLDWVDKALEATLTFLDNHGLTSLAIPMIGAGIGGLKEEGVKAIFTRHGEAWNGTLYVYQKYVEGK